jgi:AcrR family transcriptional regulator
MELRDRIIQTTTGLFFENGIKSVTMDIIAETMGISKRTLYETFSDKNQLVDDCMIYVIQQSEIRSEEIRSKASNFIEAMLMLYKEGNSESRKCNKNFTTDLRRFHPVVYQRIKEHRERAFKVDMIVELDKGIMDGYIRSDLNTEIMAILLRSQIDMIEEELPELRRFPLSEIFKTAFMSFIRGISTPKGLKVIDDFVKKHDNKF